MSPTGHHPHGLLRMELAISRREKAKSRSRWMIDAEQSLLIGSVGLGTSTAAEADARSPDKIRGNELHLISHTLGPPVSFLGGLINHSRCNTEPCLLGPGLNHPGVLNGPAPCVIAESGFSCSYPPSGPIVRRPRKTTINDVASRISQMEKTIEAFKSGEASSPQPLASTTRSTSPSIGLTSREIPPESTNSDQSRHEGLLLSKGKVSHYVNEVLFSRVIEQEDDVRTALATPRLEPPRDVNSPASPFNPMAMLTAGMVTVPIASFHPPRQGAIRLWKVFTDCVDSCTKVVHVPTAETILYTVINDPAKATIENLGLCFAIYYASATALGPSEIHDILGEDKQQILHRFKIGLEQSLAQAEFLESPTVTLLQALAIYSAAMRVHNTGRAVWIINGLALRAAQSIGLHRDGSKLGLSVFESEIRRRVWWHFLERDSRGAEDYGLQNPTGSYQQFGVDQPRNLHDHDLFPEMKELPPSRPDWTRMTLPLCNNQASRAWSQLFQMSTSTDGIPGEDARKQVIKKAMERVEEILERCNPVIPEQRMTIRIARMIIRKVDVVSRRQWQTLRQSDSRCPKVTEGDVLEAVELLELANGMWQDDDMEPFHWISRAFPQYHMMLCILRNLCVCPWGPHSSRAFAAVEFHLDSFKVLENGPLTGLKWTVLMTLRERALLIMQKVEENSKGVQEGQNKPQAGFEGSGDGVQEVQQNVEGDFAMPDWNTILEEFPLDMEDFSLIF
ncbi:hypothetical protein FSARC_6541 [Fusarium sarcochroum]|uniref:Xylanolytic transcriptional activator regulatory domain-containing protein n=1 Tax=Fusarium sarcochroum TaxID=1208366 RepID=A0A8H4X994_9HYPO|nr:hypothetical protein FSARC_6541 [Fusarium sarcochroum]